MQNGLPMSLTFNANGTFSASGTDECAKAHITHWSNGYNVELAYKDPAHAATAVSVSGPGISGSLALPYNGDNGGSWNTYSNMNPSLGSTYPSGLPYTYTYTITDASGTWTTTQLSESCVQQQFPSNLTVTGATTGTPTFSWTGIGDASAVYLMELQNPAGGNYLWSTYNATGTSIVYNGPALTLGVTYYYYFGVQSSSTCNGGSSLASGSFTYQ